MSNNGFVQLFMSSVSKHYLNLCSDQTEMVLLYLIKTWVFFSLRYQSLVMGSEERLEVADKGCLV
jgi:hypothetical protein